MLRTSLYFPEDLHYRLQTVSKIKKVSISAFIRTAVEKLLEIEERTKLDDLYEAMEATEGICKDDVTDASTTIDDVLYGEKGAWSADAK